jgi:hypothetical protein
MKRFIDRPYTVVNRGALGFREFAASGRSHILKSDEQLPPTVPQRRAQRISLQNKAQRHQAAAVAPSVDETLKRPKQFGVVPHRRISPT